MKHLFPLIAMLLAFTFTSCELIGDIFSAGFYTGLFVVVLLIAIVIFIIMKLRKK